MLTAIKICRLNGSVGRAPLVSPLSSCELDPYISIFIEPLVLEVELGEITWAIPKSTSDWLVKKKRVVIAPKRTH